MNNIEDTEVEVWVYNKKLYSASAGHCPKCHTTKVESTWEYGHLYCGKCKVKYNAKKR